MAVDVEQEVKSLLSKITGVEADKIALDTDLINDLDVDSLKIIEIATEIEKRFKITIPEDQMISIRKVGDSVELLKKLLADKG